MNTQPNEPTQMLLAPDEVGMIKAHRAAKLNRERRDLRRRNTLATASAFYAWVTENGRDMSFSTFVNEFGATTIPDDQDLGPLYEDVKEVIGLVEARVT